MSYTRSIPSHTTSTSSNASLGDQTTRALHSSFHDGDSQDQSGSPLMTGHSSGRSSALNSPAPSDISGSINDDYNSHLPTATATKRDKLIGKVERIVSKAVRDPELHERAMLREVGGKELADGLAIVDSKDL
ncbi:unnamed protein product [Rhizoctonia solani]|uniref:Uncharacterized protein n=1 Tax=Rhizoctonia solani TaxID=456999 RepID=A0A8H2WA20_9AGAM|nr:unnamed protein product [Rhizoctonia solani]